MRSGVIGLGLPCRDQVVEHLACHLDRQWLSVERPIGADANEGSLELADVVRDVACYELEYVRRDLVVVLGLLGEDRQAGLEIRRLDVGDQPHLEPAS